MFIFLILKKKTFIFLFCEKLTVYLPCCLSDTMSLYMVLCMFYCYSYIIYRKRWINKHNMHFLYLFFSLLLVVVVFLCLTKYLSHILDLQHPFFIICYCSWYMVLSIISLYKHYIRMYDGILYSDHLIFLVRKNKRRCFNVLF